MKTTKQIKAEIKSYINLYKKAGETKRDFIAYAYNKVNDEPESVQGWTKELIDEVVNEMNEKENARIYKKATERYEMAFYTLIRFQRDGWIKSFEIGTQNYPSCVGVQVVSVNVYVHPNDDDVEVFNVYSTLKCLDECNAFLKYINRFYREHRNNK